MVIVGTPRDTSCPTVLDDGWKPDQSRNTVVTYLVESQGQTAKIYMSSKYRLKIFLLTSNLNQHQHWWKHIAHLIMFLCAASASTDWECWCYVTLRWCNQLSSLHLSLDVKTDTSSHSADNLSYILTKILTLILHSAALTQVWVSCCTRQPRASAHMLTSAAGWRWNLPGWREYSALQWRVCSVASVFAGWN